ncbi:MAG TPA: hypothetical protein VFL29_02480 [Candidatus Dormibacteraeota bacterium]|nr:hypothetical protein [Candidatus Dormibacteraeota bacterium]
MARPHDVPAGAIKVRGARLIVAAAAALVGLAILFLSRGFNFYFDEWNFILTAPNWTWLTILEPHNEHPAVLPRLIYAALLDTVGLRAYWPYMALLLALHALNAFLLFELVRRRSGDLIGIAAAALLLVLGAGWENLLWAFQMTFAGSVTCGLGALLALQRMSGPRGTAAVVALTLGSLLFSGIGLFFAVAVVVQMAMEPARRRELVWLAPVGVALAVWYVTLGRTGAETNPPPSVMNITTAPVYIAWGLGAAAAGIIGEGGWWGPVALIVSAAAVGWSWRRRAPDPFALSVAAAMVSLYAVTALTRGQFGHEQAGSGRYVYEGAIFWLLLLADAAIVLPWRGTWRPALAALVFLACFNSAALLFEFGTAKTVQMQREGADLQALNSLRADPCVKPNASPDDLVMPYLDSAALYYRAVDLYGDPAPSGPIVDRSDYDRARQNLLFTNCR